MCVTSGSEIGFFSGSFWVIAPADVSAGFFELSHAVIAAAKRRIDGIFIGSFQVVRLTIRSKIQIDPIQGQRALNFMPARTWAPRNPGKTEDILAYCSAFASVRKNARLKKKGTAKSRPSAQIKRPKSWIIMPKFCAMQSLGLQYFCGVRS